MLSLSYRYLSDVKNEYQMKYQTFTCPVWSEIVNQILYQKTGRSGQIADSLATLFDVLLLCILLVN